MQQARQTAEFKKDVLAETGLAGTELAGTELAGVSVTERKRVVKVVETLTKLRGTGESLAEVAHDARNMVTALGLYCDLLEEPGVLSPSFQHYAGELRLVATASRRLVEKLLTLDARIAPDVAGIGTGLSSNHGAARAEANTRGAERLEQARRWDLLPPEPIKNMAWELLSNRNLLAALAGPSIALRSEEHTSELQSL